MSLTEVTVTGSFRRPDGVPSQGEVLFRLTSPLYDADTDTIVSNDYQRAVMDENGDISIDLVALDDVGIVPQGQRYEVTEHHSFGKTVEYEIEVLVADAPTADLATLVRDTGAVPGLGSSLAVAIASKVAKVGDTMTGPLTLAGDPGSALVAAPKQYVDAARAAAIAASQPVDADLTAIASNGATATGLAVLGAASQAAARAAIAAQEAGTSVPLTELYLVSPSGDTTGVADTAAIAAAFTAGATKVLLSGFGTTYWSNTFLVPAGKILDLSQATVKAKSALNNDVIRLTNARSTVRGGVIDGNLAAQASSTAGVSISGDDCIVEDTYIKDCFYVGVQANNCNRPKISRVGFSKCGASQVGPLYYGVNNGSAYDGPTFESVEIDQSMLTAAQAVGVLVTATGAGSVVNGVHVRGITAHGPAGHGSYTSAGLSVQAASSGVINNADIASVDTVGFDSGLTFDGVTGLSVGTITTLGGTFYGVEVVNCSNWSLSGYTIVGSGTLNVGVYNGSTGGNGSIGAGSISRLGGTTPHGIRAWQDDVVLSGYVVDMAGTTGGSALVLRGANVEVGVGRLLNGANSIVHDGSTTLHLNGVNCSGAATSVVSNGGTITDLSILGCKFPGTFSLAGATLTAGHAKVLGNDGLADYLDYSTGVKLGNAGRRYKSGKFYGAPSGRLVAQALALNVLYLVPLDVSVTTAFDRIGMNISSAGGAGSIVKLCLFADDGTGAGPTGNDLLGLVSTIDGTSATAQSLTIAQTLTPGRWWLGAVAQVAAPSSIGADSVTHDSSIALNLQSWGYGSCLAQSGVSGALPTPVAPNDARADTPLIYVRAA